MMKTGIRYQLTSSEFGWECSAGLLITAEQQKRSTGEKGGRGGKQIVRRIKFPWLICRSSCREVKVKANPAVRGARIKVFEIWIQGLSSFQYQGLSIISVDRRSIPLAFLFLHLQGDFWQCFHGVLSMKALPLMTRWELSFRLRGFNRSCCSRAAGESGEAVSLRIL